MPIDVLGRIPSRDQVMRAPGKVLRGAGHGLKSGATLTPVRKGKEPTAEFNTNRDNDATRQLRQRQAAERQGRVLQRETSELEGSTEIHEQKNFAATEKVAINLVNNEVRAATDQQNAALKKDKDGGGRTEHIESFGSDPSNRPMIEIDALLQAAVLPDKEFNDLRPEDKKNFSFLDDSGNRVGKPVIIHDEGSGKDVTINAVVEKKGGKFVCSVDGGGTVEVDPDDLIRAKVIAEAELIRNRFRDNANKQKLFDMYIDGISGNKGEMFKMDDVARGEFVKKVNLVCAEQGIPTYEGLAQGVDKLFGNEFSEGDPEPTDPGEKRRYNQWRNARKNIDRNKDDIIPDGTTLTSLFWEDHAQTLQETQAREAQAKQAVEAGHAPASILVEAQMETAALSLAGEHRDIVNAHFNGVINGTIPLEQARKADQLIRNGDLAGAMQPLIPEISGHVKMAQEQKEAWQEHAKKVGRNRKVLGVSFLAMLALAYMAQSQLTNE